MLLIVATVSLSCKEDKIKNYHGENAMNMSVNGSSDITFKIFPDLTEYEFTMNVSLVGYQSDRDRTVRFVIDPATDQQARAGITLPDAVTLPAGESVIEGVAFKVQKSVLSNDDESVTVAIGIDPGCDFMTGTSGPATVTVTNGYPPSWYGTGFPGFTMLTYYMGVCTKAKYRFFEYYMGYVDLAQWPGDPGNYTQAVALLNELNDEIARIQREEPDNDIIREPNGAVIRFWYNT